MKIIISAFLLFISLTLPVFSQSEMGGQTGSGGNGCWVDDSEQWKSLEEILYEDSFNRYDGRDSFWYRNNFFRYLRFGHFVLPGKNYIYEKDLRDTPSFRRGLGILRNLRDVYPRTHKAIRELYELFGSVYISTTVPEGIYEGSVTNDDSVICDKYSPGILSFKDGSVVFFKPVIDKIDHISTIVIFVHEAIRFAQMFHPAFQDLSNEDLELFTASLFDWSIHEEIRPVLVDIENKLINKNYPLMNVEEQMSPTTKMWRTEINRALQKGEPLGSALLKLRRYNSSYSSKSYKALNKFIKQYRKN